MGSHKYIRYRCWFVKLYLITIVQKKMKLNMKTDLRLTLPTLMLAMAGMLYSCADKDEIIRNEEIPSSKEKISFTSDAGAAFTRASLGNTRAGFDSDTKIVMRIKAEDLHQPSGATRYTRTYALAKPHTTSNDSHNGTNLLPSSFQHSDVEMTGTNVRYWDDAFGRYSKLSVYAVCIPSKKADAVLPNDILEEGSAVDAINNPDWFTETTENEKLTWEVPASNQTTEQTTGLGTLISQTQGTLETKDLCYSNNIRNGATTSEKGVYHYTYSSGDNTWSTVLQEGQMAWYGKDGKLITESTETAGKFDQGHLIFKHAMTKYTINLKEGEGFNPSIYTDFQFTNSSENVALLGFPTKGTFNLANATWTVTERNGVKNLPELTTSANNGNTKKRTLQAISLPGYDLTETPLSNAIQFTIDDNLYYVTKQQIQDKISEWATANSKQESSDEFHKFAPGHHYVINITVGKTKIENITAELVEWETVSTEEITPENSYITMNLEERGSSDKITTYNDTYSNKFKIYRVAETANTIVTHNGGFETFRNWKTGYNTDGAATHTWDGTTSSWKTNWYWLNNKTAYHFRIAGNAATDNDNPNITQDGTNGDYFTIASGSIDGTSIKNSSSEPYNDYTWGAPFYDVDSSYKFVYTKENGFTYKENNSDYQISHAIGATKSRINMMLFHMTSQIFVNVTTSLNNDPSRVVLDDGTNHTKVEILRFYDNGKVYLGNGKEEVTGSIVANKEISFVEHVAESGTTPAKSTFSFGMVPQTLNRFVSGTDNKSYKVGLRITTPDGNQYVVENLSTMYAIVNPSHLKNPYTTPNSEGKYLVNYWYPGFKYTYNVKISKTGIVNITAQLVDWETVEGDLGNITLEN